MNSTKNGSESSPRTTNPRQTDLPSAPPLALSPRNQGRITRSWCACKAVSIHQSTKSKMKTHFAVITATLPAATPFFAQTYESNSQLFVVDPEHGHPGGAGSAVVLDRSLSGRSGRPPTSTGRMPVFRWSVNSRFPSRPFPPDPFPTCSRDGNVANSS